MCILLSIVLSLPAGKGCVCVCCSQLCSCSQWIMWACQTAAWFETKIRKRGMAAVLVYNYYLSCSLNFFKSSIKFQQFLSIISADNTAFPEYLSDCKTNMNNIFMVVIQKMATISLKISHEVDFRQYRILTVYEPFFFKHIKL